MNVTSGISAEDASGRWQKISVSLSHEDFLRLAAEGKLDPYKIDTVPRLDDPEQLRVVVTKNGAEIDISREFAILQIFADIYVLTQMFEVDVIPKSVHDSLAAGLVLKLKDVLNK